MKYHYNLKCTFNVCEGSTVIKPMWSHPMRICSYPSRESHHFHLKKQNKTRNSYCDGSKELPNTDNKRTKCPAVAVHAADQTAVALGTKGNKCHVRPSESRTELQAVSQTGTAQRVPFLLAGLLQSACFYPAALLSGILT